MLNPLIIFLCNLYSMPIISAFHCVFSPFCTKIGCRKKFFPAKIRPDGEFLNTMIIFLRVETSPQAKNPNIIEFFPAICATFQWMKSGEKSINKKYLLTICRPFDILIHAREPENIDNLTILTRGFLTMMLKDFRISIFVKDEFNEVGEITVQTAKEAKTAIDNYRRAVPAMLSRGVVCDWFIVVIYSVFTANGKYYSESKTFKLY